MNFKNIFSNKTVLLTGHTGFKGSWLSIWLNCLGANVVGVSLNVPTNPSHYYASNVKNKIHDYRVDIHDSERITKLVKEVRPDFVFHLAAQALVISSYVNPVETMSTNAIGSANILQALRVLNKEIVVVMITSDKAYDNLEWVWGYRENDRLGGKDPYSASKAMAELVINSFFHSYFKDKNCNIRLAIARAGNVIGGGDWSENRLVPDCIKSWANNGIAEVRNPNATRPWQHVLEPLSGYLSLAMQLHEKKISSGEAYNFGPTGDQNKTVSELIGEMSKYWDLVKWTELSKDPMKFYESGLLKLNCDKALIDLEWQPTLNFDETVRFTIEWYRNYYKNQLKSVYDFTLRQIQEYMDKAKLRDINWARE